MKKYLILYHAPAEAMLQMVDATPEEQAKGMEDWISWFKKCGDKIVDAGNPLINGQKLSMNGELSNSDKDVTGYSVIQVENLKEATELLKDNPHLSGWNADCTIELHEVNPVPGI